MHKFPPYVSGFWHMHAKTPRRTAIVNNNLIQQNTSEKRSSLPDVFYPEYYLITDYLSTAQYLP